MLDMLIVNGQIVDSDGIYHGNIGIKDGKIVSINNSLDDCKAIKIYDAEGKYLFPGGIDTHMHIGEYNADFEDMETSTAAAAVGGMTCLLDMPLNLMSPSIKNVSLFEEKKHHLSEKSYTDFGMYGAFVPENISDLSEMQKAGAIAFKSFLPGAGKDFGAPNMATTRKALEEIASFGGIAAFHCEDDSIIQDGMATMISENLNSRQAFLDSRPLVAETMAVKNIIELAKETKAKVHICHVSHPEVAQIIFEAQQSGIDVSAETCVHYLVFSESDLIDKGCLYKCAPPLREKTACEGLWKYIENGTLTSLASDHSPGMLEDRDDSIKPIYEVGNGISGVQTVFQTYFDLITSRGLSPSLIAKTLSEQPAKRFGLFGQKGALRLGFDADIVVVDPEYAWEVTNEELLYKQKISAFVGLRGQGKPVATFIRGRLVAQNGTIVSKAFGKFVCK